MKTSTVLELREDDHLRIIVKARFNWLNALRNRTNHWNCPNIVEDLQRVRDELAGNSECRALSARRTKPITRKSPEKVCDQRLVIKHNPIPAFRRVRLIIDSITETNMDLNRFVLFGKTQRTNILPAVSSIRLEPNRDLYPSCNLFLQSEKSQPVEHTCRMICSCVPVSVDVCHTLHTLNLSWLY